MSAHVWDIEHEQSVIDINARLHGARVELAGDGGIEIYVGAKWVQGVDNDAACALLSLRPRLAAELVAMVARAWQRPQRGEVPA